MSLRPDNATLLVSDVHANLQALEAVLSDFADRYDAASTVSVAGDVVGYGARPNEVIELLASLSDCVAVKGNHDAAAIGDLGVGDFNPVAAEAARWSGRQLSRESAEWIGRLPAMTVRGDVTLCHGSPRDPMWEYLIDAEQFQACVGHLETRGCVFGHTHVPAVFGWIGGSSGSVIPKNGERLDLGEFETWFLNPGSVGQPRDGDSRASYAVILRDFDAAGTRDAAVFHRVEYDVASAQRDILNAGLPPMLAHRLAIGR